MRSSGSSTDTLTNALAPILQARGLDLVDVEMNGAQLTVFVDREGGINLDELGEATRDVSAALDEIDPFPGRYTLVGLEPRARAAAPYPGALRRSGGGEGDGPDQRRDGGRAARDRDARSDRTRRAARWPAPRCPTASCASPTTRSSGRGRCSSGGPTPETSEKNEKNEKSERVKRQ